MYFYLCSKVTCKKISEPLGKTKCKVFLKSIQMAFLLFCHVIAAEILVWVFSSTFSTQQNQVVHPQVLIYCTRGISALKFAFTALLFGNQNLLVNTTTFVTIGMELPSSALLTPLTETAPEQVQAANDLSLDILTFYSRLIKEYSSN